jgi:hypothetical protein
LNIARNWLELDRGINQKAKESKTGNTIIQGQINDGYKFKKAVR